MHPESQTAPLNPHSESRLKVENFYKMQKDLDWTMITFLPLVLIVAVQASCMSTEMSELTGGTFARLQ